MSRLVRLFIFLIIFLSGIFSIHGDYSVKKVDFLSRFGLKVNGAGPLLVTADAVRERIILVNTNTASISIIKPGADNRSVINIPLKNRVPQYLKSEALSLDKKRGNIYIVGNKSLHIVFPEKKESITIETDEQYEMVAVNDKNGDSFLVSRASPFLAFVRLKSKKIKKIKWLDKVEKIVNLNQTPPPPIRKVICDSSLNRVIATDGFSSTLYLFSANTAKLLKKRKIAVQGGKRWHFAGYNYKTHHLYMVIETAKRAVTEAVKIDILKERDVVVPLPGLSEGVGINYNPRSDQVYVPYDNHPSLHLVDFKNRGKVEEIKIPAYGNDATALDIKNDLLYISSWAYGEVDVIDLKARRLKKRFRDVGILPHMFNMAFNPGDNKLYIPLGASAVNGSFGAALTVLNPLSGKKEKIYTGWAPVDLISLAGKDSFLVFNSEDEFAEVKVDGSFKILQLPYDYPCHAVHNKTGNINLSYGPHQSYWPTVYIWASRNGIMGIDAKTLALNDRRIPRLSHRIVVAKDGALYGLQNNWGREKQFIFSFPDEIRHPNLGNQRIELDDYVQRETTQRILKYDPAENWLYLVRTGEKDEEAGILQVIDLETKKVILKYPTGLTPIDLVFNENNIYVANFDSDTIAIIDKEDFSVQKIKTGNKPTKLALHNKILYVINHNHNSLQALGKAGNTYPIPFPGKPGNLVNAGENLIITSHTANSLKILSFSPAQREFTLIHQEDYPYGETSLDTNNSAFYVRGQFGDAVFEINRIKKDDKGRLWITDYLSGKLFIITNNEKNKEI